MNRCSAQDRTGAPLGGSVGEAASRAIAPPGRMFGHPVEPIRTRAVVIAHRHVGVVDGDTAGFFTATPIGTAADTSPDSRARRYQAGSDWRDAPPQRPGRAQGPV